MIVHTKIFTATSEMSPEEIAAGIMLVIMKWPFLNSHEPFARKLKVAVTVTADE